MSDMKEQEEALAATEQEYENMLQKHKNAVAKEKKATELKEAAEQELQMATAKLARQQEVRERSCFGEVINEPK